MPLPSFGSPFPPVSNICALAVFSVALGGCSPASPPAKVASDAEVTLQGNPPESHPSSDAAVTQDPATLPDADNPAAGQQPPQKTAAGGRKAPAFSLESVTSPNTVATLVAGKVTVVAFCASFAAPCKKAFPELQGLYGKYKTKGLEVVVISVDEERDDIVSFVQANPVQFQVGWDSGTKVTDAWKPNTLPSSYVVDKQGTIRYEHSGYKEGDIAKLEEEVKTLF